MSYSVQNIRAGVAVVLAWLADDKTARAVQHQRVALDKAHAALAAQEAQLAASQREVERLTPLLQVFEPLHSSRVPPPAEVIQKIEGLRAEVERLKTELQDVSFGENGWHFQRERADRAEAREKDNAIERDEYRRLAKQSEARLAQVCKALKRLKVMPWMQGRLDNSDRWEALDKVDAILALAEGPHPVCETCGGTRLLTIYGRQFDAMTPCPDCAEGN